MGAGPGGAAEDPMAGDEQNGDAPDTLPEEGSLGRDAGDGDVAST